MRLFGSLCISFSRTCALVLIFLGFVCLSPNVLAFQEGKSASLSAGLDEFLVIAKQGMESRLEGDFKQSIRYFEQALAVAQKWGEPQLQVQALQQLGYLFWNVGQVDDSNASFISALSLTADGIKETQKDIRGAISIYTLYKQGKEYRHQGRYKDSIACFEKAVALALEIKSPEHQVKCLRQLGVTYWEMNEIEKFFRANRQAIEIARAVHHRTEEGKCAYNIGLYYSHQNDYSLALKHYEDALRIFKATNDTSGESDCLTNISDVYIQVGNYENALDTLTEVLRIDRELDEEQYVAMDLNNIGVIYRKKGLQSDRPEDLHRALSAFAESLQISRRIHDEKTEVQCLNNLGTIYTDLDEYDEALHHLKLGLDRAEKLEDIGEISTLHVNRGIVYAKQGKFELSVEALQKAIVLAHQINDENILWEAYAKSGDALKKLGIHNRAYEDYKKSIDVIENIRTKIQLEELKASYLGTDERIDAYYSLIDLLYRMSQEEPERSYDREAFLYMEKAKARAFIDRMELSRVDVWMGVNPDYLERQDGLMKEMAKINSQLIRSEIGQDQRKELIGQMKELEQELEILKRKIRVNSPSYADLTYPGTISAEEAQAALLDGKTAFFAYCIGEDNSYLFVITKEKVRVLSLPPAGFIRPVVKDYLQIITDKDSQDFQLGYELFKILVGPGLECGMEKIIFVPDDILHFLSFEALVTREDSLRWLIKDYKISYVPSVTSFHELQNRERSGGNSWKKDILSFGNPYLGPYEGQDGSDGLFTRHDTRDDFRLSRLEYSQAEVEAIAALFKKKRRDVYTGEMATEARFKSAGLMDYEVIHFATHGLIDNCYPARSSIVLSLGDLSSEDGFLQMREVFNLKLSADLVTLSACQTGLGQFIKGEGIEGISRAFLFAGASSVLMSLWAVNDQASYQFMRRFYIHLHSSHTIVDALRRSKLELIDSKTLSHPFFWAGFIVSGKADKVLFSSSRRKLSVPVFVFVIFLGFIFLKPLKKLRSLLSAF